MTRGAALGLLLALAACATAPDPAGRAFVPGDAFGFGDPDLGAIEIASVAFSGSARTRDDPAAAARAAAAFDYLAGALPTSPRWACLSPLTLIAMERGRAELRHTLGIPPDAPSQIVVDALLAASGDFQAGQLADARQALAPPLFGADAAARLQTLPFLPQTNIAATRVDGEVEGFNGSACANEF